MKARLHRRHTAEHYTPAAHVEDGRYVIGGPFDLDPGSCLLAMLTGPTAARYYSRYEDGLERPWGGAVLINPPGDRRGKLVRAFWRRACEHALFGGPGAVVLWVGFSLEQLRLLQSDIGLIRHIPCPSPPAFPMVVVARRIRWDSVTLEFEAPGRFVLHRRPGRSPTNANYFCLLGGNKDQRARFRERFGKLGDYTPGRRLPRCRNLRDEILCALHEHGPHKKRALARRVKARTSDVLAEVNRLLSQGLLVQRNHEITFP